jgi:hypothetical protein
MRRSRMFRLLLILLASGAAGSAFATDWLQFGYDQAQSSFNRAERGYSTSGNAAAPGFAAGISLPTSSDSTPILLGGVSTASGIKDLIFLTAKNGTLLALDGSNASVVWSKRPTGGGTLSTGAPAVDPNLQYVYAYGHDGNVHKYQVGDGTEITGGGWPELSTLKPDVEKGAAGLSIAATPGGTFLYSVTDGYVGDAGDYQGHITAINLADGSQKVFNSECSTLTIHFIKNGVTSGAGQNDCASHQNGIWGRAGAIYDAGTNRVFISTGNGPYNASSGGKDWGDSVLALNPDGSGSGGGMPVDSYTPTTFQQLQNTDADLGSVSVAIVPPPAGTAAAYQHIGVQPGKDGCVRLINLADMSGLGAPAHTGGELDAKNLPGGSNCASGNDGPEIKPQPAVWVNPADGSSWIYVTSYGNGSAAYKVALDGAGKPSLTQQWTSSSGTSPVVANGTVYYISGGRVVALNATTGATIWTGPAMSSIHWQSLIVVNGHIYTSDGASKLWVFALDGIFRNGYE